MKAYLWLDIARDGFENMAIDEALAHFAIHEDAAVLRFYRWSRPFLTLGYFQKADDRLASALLAKLPYTRRLSGGGAIVHDRELTYSLAFPDSKSKKSASSNIYCAVHTVIRELLSNLGRFVQPANCETPSNVAESNTQPAIQPFLCFQRRSAADLVVGAHKVVGSAQRRVETALLQHGSILLERSDFAPELMGLNDLSKTEEPLDTESFMKQLAENLSSLLAATINLEPWQKMDLDMLESSSSATALNNARLKFLASEWIQKR